jgi:hypothetical protein
MQMIKVYSDYPESVRLTCVPLTLAESLVGVRCVADWIRYRQSIRLKLPACMVLNGSID